MLSIDVIKKLESYPNKRPYSFVKQLTINPVYTSNQTNLNGLTFDFVCTAINISIYSNTKCVLDTDPQREPILFQMARLGGTYSIFENPIDTVLLNSISNNNNFPSFTIKGDDNWVITVSEQLVLGAPILVAPINVFATFSGFLLV